jgi:hypothetical protein
MRNNEKRLGLAPNTPPDAAHNAAAASTPLAFVVPTEFVELPSQGKFYPEGHPLCGEDTVEIKFMTAKDEDILTSATLIKKGIVLDRLIDNLLVDKRFKSDSLLTGDRNAIVVAARQSAYGASYETTVTCPDCDKDSVHSFDLSEVKHVCLGFDQEYLREENITYDSENCIFNVTLPRSQVTVGVRLLNGQLERYVSQKKEEATITDTLKMIIVSVNGGFDQNTIYSFIDAMPAADSKYLRNTYSNLTPNIDMKQDFICVYCDYINEMEVPFTAAFFWPE